MFRRFENLVDPFVDYAEANSPPTRLLPFLLSYAQPFRGLFIWSGITSVLVAAVEVGLIWAMGWIVDILVGGPSSGLAKHVEQRKLEKTQFAAAN
ncbi:hypothetical protein [Puniceibacterium sediminis]|uniref:Uncharacterized protein n=1 Tax=Puniceibacterium sediminis TaxID=1608407 RepID=A0A238Z3L8_9RHOB|nr:hypothetical protein [Puniceibacterium sediminis]SNR77900.1 hypothetical protein SAMN06265370_12327 [Puniceibacterium sediminis]